jgi:hypothetical protein
VPSAAKRMVRDMRMLMAFGPSRGKPQKPVRVGYGSAP